VYDKLPRGFFIPTPMGRYHPDRAIVFREGDVRHICFIAETTGSLESLELQGAERAKIEWARKVFAKLNTGQVKVDAADSYGKLLAILKPS
jgi:type III restriction enzyme